MYRAMQTRDSRRSERRAEQREAHALAVPLAVQRPLLPELALPVRYFLGLGLMFLCLWLPAFVTLFRR